MATTDSTSQNSSNAVSISLENGTVSDISTSLENATLHDPQEDPPQSTNTEIHDSPRRKLNVYPRPHILFLSKSPLVKTPKGMPTLKEWFGDWNDQQSSSKKDPEASGPTLGTRDRRFRRDADDSELPSRPAFRTTPSQPSQMGNFRHQSTRTTEREKDKDTDKERERDIRDKEGAEKLRSLSDKYDRDRLALSASSLRNKDRDSAPHLSAGSSTRLGQAQGANGTRRAEGREPAKRKPGESEDWRRGSEPSRSGREDRSDNGRRERDTRERPRSRSRLRRDPSSTRRDRDRDRDDRLRDRRSDDRDETRRDKDDYFRRDLDDRSRDKDETYRDGRDRREQGDREVDDDSRRWRDDGKRDERIAARRDRGWERWESGTDRDRTDDRDGRSKRTTGRDRRSGADEGKDERREREKEKEPAWMETYVPSSPGAGILGGQSTEGELDGIQAWKKGLKEKERRDKELEDPPEPSTKKSPEHTSESLPATGADSGMDEIQLFKLMMKREAEKKDEPSQNGNVESSRLNGNVESSRLDALPSLSTGTSPLLRTDSKNALSSVASVDGAAAPHADAAAPRNGLTQTEPSRTTTNGLLSLVPSVSPVSAPHSVNTERQLLDSARDDLQPAVSRFFPNPPGLHSNGPNPDRSLDYSGTSPSASFNPPQGSRLLAFASRGSGNAAPGVDAHLKAPVALETSNLHSNPGTSFHNHSKVTVSDQSPNFGAEYQYGGNGRMLPSESSVAPRSYSPFGQPSHTFAYDDMQDSRLGNESLRRVSGLPPNQFSPASESSSPYQELGNSMSNISNNGPGYDAGSNPAGANYAAGKGSRFAKFFDAKREPQANPGRRTSAGAGFVSTSPHPGQRQDALAAMNGMGVPNAENRAMEDIFAMLQNSAQTHRMSPQLPQTNNRGVGGGGAPFGPSHAELQALQLQQLQQQQYAHNRIESLYDSRLDDRNFMPDGMVPGLRPAPRPRSREPSGQLFNEHLDDPLFGVQQRLPPQVRNLDQMYSGHLYNQHAHQGIGRGAPIQLQQAQFRGGPSPIQAGNRLPPGLANLGGRPPHDPSQFLNPSMGAPGSLHGGISTNAPAQPGFNNFGAGNLGFSGNPQGRGPIPGPHHQVPISLNQMAGLGPNSNLDLRGNQAQYLGMGGVGGLSGNLRGGNFNPQHGPGAQIPAPHLAALRQQQQQQQQQQQHQQQQHLPPHLVQQILPPHLQPQQGLPVGNAQGAQDLMALLMGNHRD